MKTVKGILKRPAGEISESMNGIYDLLLLSLDSHDLLIPLLMEVSVRSYLCSAL